jgi:hypothetical protein
MFSGSDFPDLAKAHNRYYKPFRGVTRVTATINIKLQCDFYTSFIHVSAVLNKTTRNFKFHGFTER